MNALQKYALNYFSKEEAMEHFGLVEAEVKQQEVPEQFGEARLAGDDEVFIYFPGDELTVGSPVFSDAEGEEPLVDGEYELDGGASIIVAEGMVAEISEPGEEEEPEEEVDANEEEKKDEKYENADFEAFLAPHLEAFDALSTTVNELMEKFNTLVEQMDSNNKKVESLSKASAAVHKPNAKAATERTVATQNFRKLTGAEKLTKLRNKNS